MCIVVAYYFPPGNIVEEFQKNVQGLGEDIVDGVVQSGIINGGNMADLCQYGELIIWKINNTLKKLTIN